MDHPPPHSFSRSPVEEVFCLCTFGSGAGSLSLTIPQPYPGWPQTRERIRDMLTSRADVSRVSGCMLRYTDLIPVAPGTNLPTVDTLAHLLSGKFNGYVDTTPDGIMLTRTTIPGTAGSVRSMPHQPGKAGWALVFTVYTQGAARFLSSDDILDWFDDARAEIHGLFDLIVPGEIVQVLR